MENYDSPPNDLLAVLRSLVGAINALSVSVQLIAEAQQEQTEICKRILGSINASNHTFDDDEDSYPGS